MGFFIFGIVLIAVGIFLIFSAKRSEGRLLNIQMTNLTNTKNIKENWEGMSNSYGDGNFNLYVKLNGKATARKPIQVEYTDYDCAYVKTKLTREYEELTERKDSDGKMKRQWVRKQEVLVDHEMAAEGFALADEYGDIELGTDGAELHLKEVHEQFEKGDDPATLFSFNFGPVSIRSGSNVRTIGFRHQASVIPMASSLFVIGGANDRSQELSVSRPLEKDKPFIISVKREDEIVASRDQSRKRKEIGAKVLIGIGAIVAIVGILKWLNVV